ncbi:MAG: citramalate synthase [Bacillota bacterium]
MALYDTTLRDGAQMRGITFSIKSKLELVQRLDALGIDYIEGGWPASNPNDDEFFKEVRNLQLKNSVVTAFGSTRKAHTEVEKDPSVRAILDSGAPVACVFGKAWDFHVTNILGTTLEENLEMIRDTLSYLRSHGLAVIFDAEHFFDGYRANPRYALAAVHTAADAGAEVIVLCDTNGGALPKAVRRVVRTVRRETDRPLGIHAHNDCGMAVANSIIAVEEGANHVQGTINGYGERCGNADLCSIIPVLKIKMGVDCVDEEALAGLTRLSLFVDDAANLRPNPVRPFTGSSAFAHKAGVHVKALMRHSEAYEHVPPEKVGNARKVLISELSGAGNVTYKAREYGISTETGFDARAITNMLKQLEYEGYRFEEAEASFELLLRKTLGIHDDLFSLHSLRLIVDKHGPNGELLSEASVKVEVGGRVAHTVAEGNGPVNALDRALRRALEGVYPEVADIELVDYKVRVVDETSGTAAKVRVLIESANGHETWSTVGVSTNIIEASWRALVDSIEYGIRYARGTLEPSADGLLADRRIVG